MPAFRILYIRDGATGPKAITAGFDSLDQAMNVFAARGLRILYIAELPREAEARPAIRSSFPIRRFSARALA